jgi:ethanolamine ammonia-lyase small subunit
MTMSAPDSDLPGRPGTENSRPGQDVPPHALVSTPGLPDEGGALPLSGSTVPPDPWLHLRRHTPARIALGRTGVSLPTQEVLRFALAHAQARDAIHVPLAGDVLVDALTAQGWLGTLLLESRAPDQQAYLMRPHQGRRLHPESAARLADMPVSQPIDLLLVVGDGLSSLGIQQHSVPLLAAIRDALPADLRLGPLVLVRHARVAVADEIGEILGAGMTAMLIGERPGLSAPDSVGIYLTHRPRIGLQDAQRNCISNVRPAGQSFAAAAYRLAWLVTEAQRLGQTGIGLKDHSSMSLVANVSSSEKSLCRKKPKGHPGHA